jgi:HTH domain
MTGRNRRRPGLQQALAAVGEGDTQWSHPGDVRGPGDTIAELGELFSVSRATIYREIARARRELTDDVPSNATAQTNRHAL